MNISSIPGVGEVTFLAAELSGGSAVLAGTLVAGHGAYMLEMAQDNQKNKNGYRHEEAQKELPRKKNGEPQPDPDAAGNPHTQLGKKEGSKGDYNQAREFDSNGKPVKDIDFTDHGRPQNHTNPHQHKYQPSETGGTLQKGKQEPLD